VSPVEDHPNERNGGARRGPRSPAQDFYVELPPGLTPWANFSGALTGLVRPDLTNMRDRVH